MVHFGLNMPYYLMILYGSMMIAAILILRTFLKNRLPKFVFPVLWGVVLLRFLIPFSVSSPLSIPVPWNYLSPFEITYTDDAVTAYTRDIQYGHDSAAISEDDMLYGSGESSLAEDTPVYEFSAGDAGWAKTVGYNNVSISYEPETEMISVQSDNVASDYATSDYAYGGALFSNAYYDYYPSFGSVLFHNIFSMQRILLVVYILGIIIVAGILGWQKYGYMKKLRGGYLIEHNETINTMLRDMGMGHVLVFTNDEIASPMVCGLFNPRIYLPTQMDFQNTLLLRHIFTHETMHIRHKDNWAKCVMVIVLCLNWFNPLVWIMSKCLASDLEAACDAAVIRQCGEESKKDYALSLLAMAVSGSRMSLLYSAFSRTEVEKRMKNILSYKKATFFALLCTVLFMSGSMMAFASVAQAPFWTDLTAYCSSSSSRWGIDVSITRDIALGRNTQDRAERVVFDVLGSDETGNPKVIEDRIKEGLAEEFRVEKSAFEVMSSLCLSREELSKEYEPWGLSAEEGTTFWNYQGEIIRTYEDKMLGSYQSNVDGTVDVSVQRNDLGEITSVTVWHEGDAEYEAHTHRLGQYKNLPLY